MAKRKADCSELQQTISDIALALGMKPNMNVDKITAEMKQKLPWIDRDMVTESIVAANRTVQEEQTEIAKRLSAIKHEARVSEQTKKKIDEYERAVKEQLSIPGRQLKPTTSTVQLLRDVRAALAEDYRKSKTKKAERLAKSLELANEHLAALESGSYISPIKVTELEKYPELKVLIEAKKDLQNQVRRSTPEKRKRIKRAIDLLKRDLDALNKGEYETRIKQDELAEYPDLAPLLAERDALRDEKNKRLRTENAKKQINAKIAEYEKHLKDGTIPERRPPQEVDAEVAALREVRDKLAADLRSSTPAKAQRLQESIEYLRQKDEQLRNRLYVESVKKSEIESYPELSKLIIERDKLKRDVDARIRAKKPLTWGQMLMEPANFSRAVIASIDNSAVGRQGGIALLSRPEIAAKRIPASFKALRFWGRKGDRKHDLGEEFVYEAMEDIENRANRHLYHAGGLEITELDNAKGLGKREEEQVSRFMDFLKYGNKVTSAAQKPIDASQRAYVTYMNLIRADLFDYFAETLTPSGGQMSVQQAKELANYINVITGRGDLGKGILKSSAEGLNAAFFAPRFFVSRLQFLAGQPYFRAKDPKIKKLIAKEYARYAAGLAVLYSVTGLLVGEGLEALLGEDDDWFDISFDPRSSDFGKIRFGNHRVDPLSGLAQVVKFVGQQATGQQKSTNTGEVTALRDSGTFVPFFSGNFRDVERTFGSTKPTMDVQFGGRNQLQAMGHFARTKANPGVGAALNWWNNQKNVVGQDVTVLTTVGDLTIPLTPKEMVQTMIEEGIPDAVANGMLNFMGWGSQVYGDTPGTSKGLKPLRPLNSEN